MTNFIHRTDSVSLHAIILGGSCVCICVCMHACICECVHTHAYCSDCAEWVGVTVNILVNARKEANKSSLSTCWHRAPIKEKIHFIQKQTVLLCDSSFSQ